ncbi:D-tyrosyl-tRNA(Tyr) deacylase [Patescibacteria group bacterium]|nr:D-tyrosyl-tRNA(Tyr) deacylase [Patescibacteria group bacterium]
MRLVIQRVSGASVSVDGKIVGVIDKGLFVLVGVTEDDTKENADFLAEKLSKLRILADDNSKMNLSVADADASILVVSQFTLYADCSKGNRPSFIKATEPKLAEEIYNYFIEKLKGFDVKVETGEFGAYMNIDTQLNGPVTIILEK